MSRNLEERISRTEEIRAIFIFGLLAVFAYAKTQYQTLKLDYPNGNIDIIPIINILLILWSMYAFFMVLGLSKDTIGRSASIFRDMSKVFLQYSFIMLGFFGFLYGLIIYDLRFILFILVLTEVLIGSFIIYLKRRKKHIFRRISLKEFYSYFCWSNIKNSFQVNLKKAKKYRTMILGLVFLSSSTVVLYYPENWFASLTVIILFTLIAVVSVGIILVFVIRKNNNALEEYDSNIY